MLAFLERTLERSADRCVRVRMWCSRSVRWRVHSDGVVMNKWSVHARCVEFKYVSGRTMTCRPLQLHSTGLLILAVVCLAISCSGQQQPEVEISSGPVKGHVVRAETGAEVDEFCGIPFANASVRWAVPAEPTPWTVPFEANTFGPPCLQISKGEVVGVENCLTINVWAPSKRSSLSPLPVLLWIYGGGFIHGSSSVPLYNGTQLAGLTSEVIVVTFNYRLGPMGFLYLDGLAQEDATGIGSGMYGMQDQLVAMQWVQKNIGAFGGDPDKVTLFGESAGGISACIHAMSPISAGLFRNVIIESGNCDDMSLQKDMAIQHSMEFARAAGCTDRTNVVECLRTATADDLMDANSRIGGNSIFRFDRSNGTFQVPYWLPVNGGSMIPQPPLLGLLNGDWAQVPILMGANKNSMSLFSVLTPSLKNIQSWSDVDILIDAVMTEKVRLVQSQYRPNETSTSLAAEKSRIRRIYLSKKQSGLSAREVAIAFLSDAMFLCGTRRMARQFAAASSNSHVYLYSFDHHPSVPASFPESLGAYHAAEMPFVFGNPFCFEMEPCTPSFTPTERLLSESMMAYWIGFAASGTNPNRLAPLSMAATMHRRRVWPVYTAASPAILNFNLNISVASTLENADACDAWDQLLLPSNTMLRTAFGRVVPEQQVASILQSVDATHSLSGKVYALEVVVVVIIAGAVCALLWVSTRQRYQRLS